MSTGSDPAFPRPPVLLPGCGHQGEDDVSSSQVGMTLREWLTGQALAGALASTKYNTMISEEEMVKLARRAVQLADLTLLELNK